MSGSLIEIQVKDEELKRAFGVLEMRLGNQRAAWDRVGEIVVESVQRNFEQHQAPDGAPWAKPSPSYAAAKAKRGYSPENILVLHRTLMGSIHHRAGKDHVTVGTNIVYAAIHQFGGSISVGARTQTLAHKEGGGFMSRKQASRRKKGSIRISIADIGGHDVDMPARPFLGVRDDDWPKIVRALGDYIVNGA